MIRPIVVGVPSGRIKMVLWAGTEDEKRFDIKALKRGNPYVEAFGIKYYLTSKETQLAKQMAKLYIR